MNSLGAVSASVPALDDLRDRRDEILRVAAAHGARNVRVFGSVARGEARPESDVDFLVDFEAGRSALDLCGLIADLEDLLGHSVHIVQISPRTGRTRAARSAALIESEAIAL